MFYTCLETGRLTSARWCPKCRDYVALGPANDDANVRIEIRAAEIAATPGPDLTAMTFYERAGWWRARREVTADPTLVLAPEPTDEALAGWLAGVIGQTTADHLRRAV